MEASFKTQGEYVYITLLDGNNQKVSKTFFLKLLQQIRIMSNNKLQKFSRHKAQLSFEYYISEVC